MLSEIILDKEDLTINKTNTTESLNTIKSLCAERDRKERDRLRANRLEMDKREEAERERIRHSNSILNSYIEKIKARGKQQSQERSQVLQNIHDESMRRKSEDAYRTAEMTSVIHRSLMNAYDNEKNAADDFLNKHKRLLDKGRESVKREQNRTYFS